MAERVATDVVADDIIGRYRAAVRRLEALVRQGLERGLDAERIAQGEARIGDSTQAYRERQLAAARQVLAELRDAAPRVAPVMVTRAYGSAVVAVDRVTLGSSHGDVSGALQGRFGGIHQRSVAVLAGNLRASLEAAAVHAMTATEHVFARANELEGALPARGVAGIGFIGRRKDDAWRRVALEQLAEGTVSLETRRQISRRLVGELVAQGVADAATGFVDGAGRRWALDTYAEMATRTTTREATSRAAMNRMSEHGIELVTVSSHPHIADECTPYDGQTFAMPGTDVDGYDELDELPPFHPNCAHVLTPGAGNLEAFERELDAAARESIEAPPPTPAEAPTVDDGEFGPSLGDEAKPTTSTSSASRRDLEDEAYAFGDPGPETGALEAWEAHVGKLDRAATRAERATARQAERALDEALGPDVLEALNDFKAAGVKWANDADLKQALIAGEVTIDDVTETAERELTALMGRRADRERLEENRGLRKGPIPCFVCGRFKPRPSSVCDNCGDDPTSYHGSAHELDEAYGYDRLGASELGGTLGVRGRGILIQ